MITNKTGIVQPLFNALVALYGTHPEPQWNRFFATETLNGVKQIYLNRVYRNSVEKDIQECASAITGTMTHKALEDLLALEEGCVLEHRMDEPIEVLTDVGIKTVNLSGCADLIYTDKQGIIHLIDWKNTKLAKIDKARNLEDESWKKQAYIYAYLFEKETGKRPQDATFVAFPKDLTWNYFDYDDPSRLFIQQVTYSLSDRGYERALLKEIRTKIGEVLNSHELGYEPAPCSDSDTWRVPTQYGIKKPESKVYIKKSSSMEEALDYMRAKKWVGKGYYIYELPSCPTKCEHFCDAYEYCKQGKKLVKEYYERKDNPRVFQAERNIR